MIRLETPHPDIWHIRRDLHLDPRGLLSEIWRQEWAPDVTFVQDNIATSRERVLRGLHFQHPQPQGKFINVLEGQIFDVAVDLRKDSPRFGSWTGLTLNAESGDSLWVPEGFAHGFLTLTPHSTVHYKMTTPYLPLQQMAIRWDDPDLAITWPLDMPPILSAKDETAPFLKDTDLP